MRRYIAPHGFEFMKYQSEKLREMLASEYVLGTLRGPARMRFKRLMKYDARLRRLVSEWEDRLYPLTQALPETEPPQRVWRAIRARTIERRPMGAPAGFWASLGFWRSLGLISGAIAALLVLYIGVLAPRLETPPSAIAILNDDKAQPAMLVSWSQQTAARRQVKIKIVQEHPQMAPETSWELWMFPAPDRPPVSLGLVSLDVRQTLVLSETASRILDTAWGMALSVEPKYGSPTGQPTGPVIFKGPCVKMS